jgi:hypothetical protein
LVATSAGEDGAVVSLGVDEASNSCDAAGAERGAGAGEAEQERESEKVGQPNDSPRCEIRARTHHGKVREKKWKRVETESGERDEENAA